MPVLVGNPGNNGSTKLEPKIPRGRSWAAGRVWLPAGPRNPPPIQPPGWSVLRAVASPRRLNRGRVMLPSSLSVPPTLPPIQSHPWRVTAGGQPRRRGRAAVGLGYPPALPPPKVYPWHPTVGGQIRRNGRVWLERFASPQPLQLGLPAPRTIRGLTYPQRGRSWRPPLPPIGIAQVFATPLHGQLVRSPGRRPYRRDGRAWMPVPVPQPYQFGRFAGPMIVRRSGEDRARRRPGWLLRWLPIPLEGAVPATGYNVYSNGGSGPINYFLPVATVYQLSYMTAPLTYPDTWKWGIRAFNAYGEEQNLDCAVTIILDASGNDITDRPNPPIGLRAFPTAGGFVRAEWYYPPVSGPMAPTGFHVYYGLSVPLAYTSPITVSYASAIANTFVSNIGPLVDGTTYYIGVRAFNATAEEPNTVTVSVTADATGPAPVDDLVGVATAEA